MSEMIETCCRAYWNAGVSIEYATGQWDTQPEDQKQVVRLRMRAAISAMREPTEVMEDAGFEVASGYIWSSDLCGTGFSLDGVEPFWQAMIDAALRQKR